MKGFIEDIIRQSKDNTFFRQIIETGEFAQVVIMNIPVEGEIVGEVHPKNDQILYLVEGMGKAIIDGEEKNVKE